MTNTEIRTALLKDSRNEKVRITRSGEIHVLTNRNSDKSWWMFFGYTCDAEHDRKMGLL